MEILSFKIKGKLAHFRKYYANNTAFSFTIPPRTTIMGIVAAAMGWRKDSYYEDLASNKIHFGVRVLRPIKKSFHRLNLLSIKSVGDLSKKWSSDFRGEGGRIQTPFQIVSAWDIGKGDIEYQIFLTPRPETESVFDQIKQHFLEKEPVFNISLGTANFNASLYEIELINEDKIVKKPRSDDYVLIHSAIPVDILEDLKFEKEENENYNFIEEDMLPGEFVKNYDREVKKMNYLLFSITPNPLRVKINTHYYQLGLESDDEKINIQFMDL